MLKREKIAVEKIEDWVKRYVEGASSVLIAKGSGVTSATIRNYLRKAGVAMRPKGRSKKNV